MKVLIVNSSTNIEYRVNLIYEYLTEKGYDVTVIASDFMHSSKTRRDKAEYPYKLIWTYPYMKNISLQRLYSHYKFSRDAFKEIKDIRADVLYLVIPQNSNAEIGRWYKKLYPEAKVIIDVVDMWPESLPVKGTDYFPFSLWADVRNRNLRYADEIITECEYYQDKLRKYCENVPMRLMPWLKRYEPGAEDIVEEKCFKEVKNRECIRLCYLGAVNNIIDMDRIAEIIRAIRHYAKVELDIIGKGERMSELIAAAELSGAKVVNHGAIYDEIRKKHIMDSCDFGLNIMKDTVCVGLTMKSIDYMAAGLPMINNIPGDTFGLVKEHNIGINIGAIEGSKKVENLWFGKEGEKLFSSYDREDIRRLFRERFDAGNIGMYLGM